MKKATDDQSFSALAITAIFLFCGTFGFMAVLIASGAIMEALVLQALWSWFLVPAFSLSALSLPTAIGISLLMGLVTSQYKSPSDNTNSNKATAYLLSYIFIRPLFCLVVGYVALWFI